MAIIPSYDKYVSVACAERINRLHLRLLLSSPLFLSFYIKYELIDFIRHNKWYRQNLLICLYTSFLYIAVYWYFDYLPLLLPAGIFMLLTFLSLTFFYIVKNAELSFYTIYANFFLVLPLFTQVVDVNFAIISVYLALLVNAFLMVSDKHALMIISLACLTSFITFVYVNLYHVNNDILDIPLIDFTLSFIILLSVINTLLQFNYERTLRTQELDDKNKELEKYIKSNLELENFAFIASHDLRSPIRNIMSFSQLLKAKTTDRLNPREISYLDMIINSTSNMDQMVSDILKYSKSDTIEYQTEQLALNTIVNDVLVELESLIEKKSASIHVNISNEHHIHGDKPMLHSAFLNLLLNAINYVEEDTLPVIKVTSQSIKNDIVISIIDNGIGIEPAYRETVFLLFKRLHNESAYPGNGIGLSIVKKILEKHNGKIWIESNPSGGSIFKLAIPKDKLD